MRFDTNAPGGGVEAVCTLENGKAFLEWKLYFAEDAAETGRNGAGMHIRIYVTDREGNLVLECGQQLREEEPLQSVLLQPRLWRGVEEPYLYDMEAILADGSGCCRDRVRGCLPLRSLSNLQSGSLALNGAAWEPRAVRYFLPDKGGGADRCRQMEKDLRMLLELGANCVCLEGLDQGLDSLDEGLEGLDESRDGETGQYRFFLRLCDCLGFLAFGKERGSSEYAWIQEADIGTKIIRKEAVALKCGENMPVLRGEKESSERAFAPGQRTDVLLPDREHPGPCFYRYLAEWGRRPFVYIVPESVKKTESGNYTALCYSNCDRVALYSDGSLFEFQSGDREFYFREIPAKSPCIMLTAEGDGCSEALSVHKSFVKQLVNKGIWH